MGDKLTAAMHGVLKPVSQSRDAYSQVAPIQGNHSYYCAQYAHPSQTQQPQQSNSWNSSLDSSYCPYGTPSAQQGSNDAYATPGQPASAAQTAQYSGYDPSSNSYTYPEPTQLTPYTPQQAGRSEDPTSGEKDDRATYGLRYQNTVHDLEVHDTLNETAGSGALNNGAHVRIGNIEDAIDCGIRAVLEGILWFGDSLIVWCLLCCRRRCRFLSL